MSSLPSLLDRLTQGHRPWVFLALLCALLYLPGQTALPPMDRDEARFIQASRQMLESGDYVRIQFQDEMRAKKPAGIYWLQSLSVAALSHPLSVQVWPYRLPSLLAATAAVLLTFGFGRALIGARPALLGAGLLAVSLMTVSEAHLAKSDAVLLALVVAAQGILARFYVSAQTKRLSGGGGCGSKAQPGAPGLLLSLLFWLIQGFAILVKGPVLPIISLLTVVALSIHDRSAGWARSLRPLSGALVAAAVAAPWFILVSAATDGAFVGQAVKGDLLPKLLGAHESHGGFPGYYLLLAPVIFWPASLFLIPAACRGWAQRGRLVHRFLLAWALPTWIMFELIPTKLPHYVLPALPALALLAGALVMEGLPVFLHRASRLWYGIWALIGLALAGACLGLPMVLGNGFSALSMPLALGLAIASLGTAWAACRGRLLAAGAGLVVTALAAFPPILGVVLPSLDHMFLSRQLAAIIGTVGSDGPVAAAGFSEPSLVFLVGTQTRFVDGVGAADHLAAHRRALVVVSDADRAAFDQRAGQLGLETDSFGSASGVNYSRGKRVSLAVLGLKSP